MSVAERLSDEIEERFDSDLEMVLGLLAAIYVVYFGTALIIGFSPRGQINAIANLTFYIGVFGLLALALNLHWGYTGLFNIGIVGFMAVGIYVMAVAAKSPEGTASGAGGFGLPIWLAIVIGTVAAALLGVTVALPALRLRADYLAIVTIAMSEIVRFTFLSRTFQEFSLFGYDTGFGGGSGLLFGFDPLMAFVQFAYLTGPYNALVDLAGVVIRNNPEPVVQNLLYGVVLLLFVVGYYVVLRRLGNSPFGRVLKAIREDEEATQSLGKNTNLFKIKAFMLGCALMGLGGILWYMQAGTITPNTFRPRLTFYIWIALIIGGAGSNTGSILGGAVFAAVLFQGPLYFKNVVETVFEVDAPNSFGRAAGPLLSSFDPIPMIYYVVGNIRSLQRVIMGVALIWLMHNRPQGLLGHRKEEAASIPLRAGGRTSGPDATATDGGRDVGGETDE